MSSGNMSSAVPFEFREPDAAEIPSVFLCPIPGGIQSTDELLAALSARAQFPDLSGDSWDSAFDCLRDFSWVKKRTIMVVHRDLPLQSAREECRTYLNMLRHAVLERQRGGHERELVVLFPPELREEVLAVLER
jgi:hypothetical protein